MLTGDRISFAFTSKDWASERERTGRNRANTSNSCCFLFATLSASFNSTLSSASYFSFLSRHLPINSFSLIYCATLDDLFWTAVEYNYKIYYIINNYYSY